MNRDEAHAAIDAIESNPAHLASVGGGSASRALIDLIPEGALALLGTLDQNRNPLGHLGVAFDGSGAYVSWFGPGRHLAFEHLARDSFFVSAHGREEALLDRVEWHGMPPGVVDLSRPEAPAVVASIFEHLNPATT